jgi:hypothetical protein
LDHAQSLIAAKAGEPADRPTDLLAAMVDDQASDRAEALALRPREELCFDAELRSIQSRAVANPRAGAPVRFRGPAGVGKTTLALDVAEGLGRPVSLITGAAA